MSSSLCRREACTQCIYTHAEKTFTHRKEKSTQLKFILSVFSLTHYIQSNMQYATNVKSY